MARTISDRPQDRSASGLGRAAEAIRRALNLRGAPGWDTHFRSSQWEPSSWAPS
jgi:hypothetical protein